MTAPIDLHYWPTPNGHKVTLFLEEAGLDYTIHPVNIGKGDQFKPEFLAFSPNNKMPAIVDHAPADGGDPQTIFESGAILLYLAEKSGQFLSTDPRVRIETLEWLFWQMAGLGPMTGQYGHFNVYAPEKIPYAIERYTNEANTTRLPGYTRFDLGARYHTQIAGKDVVFRANVENVADKRYWLASGSFVTNAAGRTYMLSASINY